MTIFLGGGTTNRYASKEMSFVWSPIKKFRTWRLLWIALATAEKELGERPFFFLPRRLTRRPLIHRRRGI